LAASYAAFGNAGVFSEPFSIREIVYRDGETKKTFKPKSKPAMKDSTAFMVTDMLRDVVSERRGASGKAAIIPGLDVAGKTGTTNYTAKEFNDYNLSEGSAPDIWFAGYTTNYSIAVWTGYKERKNAINTADSNERTLHNLRRNVRCVQKVKTPRFKRPSSVVEATVEVGTSPLRLASEFTPDNLKQTELFVRGSEPTEVSEEYEQIEVDAPSNFKAEYSEGDQSATLSWKHKAPKRDKELDVAFEVSFAVDGGSPSVLQTTNQEGLIVTGITPGSTYTFSVVAIADGVRSEPTSTTLEIDAVEVPEQGEDETPGEGEGDGQGNGEGNGNGEGEGNGEGGSDDGSDEGTTPPEDDGTTPPEDDGTTPPEEEPTPPEDGGDGGENDSSEGATNTTEDGNEARAASTGESESDSSTP
jgi:penicillin-binding protein 1A